MKNIRCNDVIFLTTKFMLVFSMIIWAVLYINYETFSIECGIIALLWSFIWALINVCI